VPLRPLATPCPLPTPPPSPSTTLFRSHALLRQVLALGVVEVGDLLGHGLEADPAGRLGAVPLPLESVQVPLASANEDESGDSGRSEEHTSELQSRFDLVCRLLLAQQTY